MTGKCLDAVVRWSAVAACRSTTIDQSLPNHIFVITLIINHIFKESYTVTKEVSLSGFSLFTVP